MAKTEEAELSMSMMKRVNDLSQLSTAIITFKRCLDDLHNHVRSIHDSLDAAQSPDGKVINLDADLHTLCRTMCSRGLRRYIMTHLSEPDRLRQVVPPALAIAAPDPAKLVLDSVGGFYLQGRKAFSHDSPVISVRSAVVLALEFFLLSRPFSKSKSESESISSSIKQESESVAFAWRRRLVNEGRLSEAVEADARGLLLFLASFGIPKAFTNEDISTLLHLSNPAHIANALRLSPHLLSRISAVIEESMKKGRSIEALDGIFTFGMEDKFSPQKILISSLKEAKEALKNRKKDMQTSARYEKHLTALRSALKCLENHNKDPTKVLPGWQLNEMIAKLEKDVSVINKVDRQATSKRREGVGASEKTKTQEHKRPRIAASQRLAGFEDRNVRSRVDVNSLYSGHLPTNAVIDGVPSRTDVYSAAALVYHGSGSDRVIRHGDIYAAPTLLSHASGWPLAEASVGSRSANALYSSGAQSGIVLTEVPEERVLDRIGNVVSNGDSLYASHIVGDRISLDNMGQRHSVIYASPGAVALYGRSVDGFADAIRERGSYI